MPKPADPNEPLAQVVIRDWAGMITAADRKDLPAGAGYIQVNMTSHTPGELQVRRGLRLVRFDS